MRTVKQALWGWGEGEGWHFFQMILGDGGVISPRYCHHSGFSDRLDVADTAGVSGMLALVEEAREDVLAPGLCTMSKVTSECHLSASTETPAPNLMPPWVSGFAFRELPV